jgi:hypothetical protein
MAEGQSRRKYERPQIVDLSGLSARGQVESICLDGNHPWSECKSGSHVSSGTGCDPFGLDPSPSDCGPGLLAGNPECGFGSAANVGCIQGASQTMCTPGGGGAAS